MNTATPRARARAEAIERIKQLALEQLATTGAASLSLRAIAREMGMVSSALYRYFPSRDALLTALITDGYRDLAAALAEAGDRSADTPVQRWHRICMSLRSWSRSQPHRFALIYGTPVPGYVAPGQTIEPATQVMSQFLDVAAEATGPLPEVPEPGPELSAQLARLPGALGEDLPVQRCLAAVGAIGQLFGLLALEAGGHLVGTFEPADALYEHTVAYTADLIGL